MLDNKQYWNEFYKTHKFSTPSSFARFCLPYIKGSLVDLGCGDGRDVRFFIDNNIGAHGVDASNEDIFIMKQQILPYIAQNPSADNVYTRFVWHAITDEEQEAILSWTSKRLFIEARTNKEKAVNLFGKHKRKNVDVAKLLKKLEAHKYTIKFFHEGKGLSVYRGDDPHLVRIIADHT